MNNQQKLHEHMFKCQCGQVFNIVEAKGLCPACSTQHSVARFKEQMNTKIFKEG